MTVSHIPFDLLLWNKCSYRVNDNNINRPWTYHCLCNLKGLISTVRLWNIEFIDIYSDILCVYRIQCMLCIDKSGNSASLLNLRNHVKCDSCLTTWFRTINLNHTSLWHTAKSKCQIKTQTSGRNCLYSYMRPWFSQPHHCTLTKIFLQLCDRCIQCFLLLFVIRQLCNALFACHNFLLLYLS